jgi:hypothetical protein
MDIRHSATADRRRPQREESEMRTSSAAKAYTVLLVAAVMLLVCSGLATAAGAADRPDICIPNALTGQSWNSSGLIGGSSPLGYSVVASSLAISRGEMAALLASSLAGNGGAVPDGPTSPTFSDVPLQHRRYREIEYAASTELMSGYPDGRFRPEEVLSRAELTAIVARVAAGSDDDVPEGSPQASFADVLPGDPWYRHVEYLSQLGISRGYPDGLFHPESTCTSAEAEQAVQAALSSAAVDYWSYPRVPWNVSRHFGTWVSGWGYHLGDDVPAPAYTSVMNARWGYIRHVGWHTSYGYVVIIESPLDWEPSSNPATWRRPVCQVFGHLRWDSYLSTTKAKVGTMVDRSWVVGHLGTSSENGGYTPHLHYGLRKGRYTSSWAYWGYSTSYAETGKWYHPCAIIPNY